MSQPDGCLAVNRIGAEAGRTFKPRVQSPGDRMLEKSTLLFQNGVFREGLLAEQQLEIWAYVNCKSPGCNCRILLDKLGYAQPFRHPVGALSPDSHCADFEERCPECGVTHAYTKRDVLVSDALDMTKIPAGPASVAFRRALARETDAQN